MTRFRRRWKTVGAALCAGIILGPFQPVARAQVAEELEAVRQEMRQLRQASQDLRAQVQALEDLAGADGQQRQKAQEAREIQALVREVLADADTRASLLEQGLTAGHDGKFFLASADGAFRLNIGGQVQMRYIANVRNEPASGDEVEAGFQLRRTRLVFDGHVADPRITYRIQTEASRSTGGMSIADLNLGYALTDHLGLTLGRKKAPFLKEEMHSSGRQLAAERSAINSVFSGARSTGIELAYRSEPFRAYVMVNDGFNTAPREFNSRDTARVGVTGRGEVKLAGDWRQSGDFVAWGEQPLGVFLGAAGHWEHNATDRFSGRFADTRDFAGWTADASLYVDNFSAFAAVAGRHDTRVVADAEKFDDFGFLMQGGYMINDRIAPFARYELLVPDSGRDTHNVSLVTAGANYYLRGHHAKLTADVTWALDPLSDFFRGSSGLGLLPDADGERHQLVFRAQFQVLF